MRILIIGGQGLLGQKLVHLGVQYPDLQICATTRREASPVDGVIFHRLDITDSVAIKKSVHSIRPDAVVITAAMTQADECEVNRDVCWQTNAASVKEFVSSANAIDAHVTYVSTDFVFSGEDEFLTEDAVPDPVNYYGKSKLAAEEWVRHSAGSWCIVRTALVYGVSFDMSRSNIVLWVRNSLQKGQAIRVVNDQWRTPTYAEDLAAGCLSAVRKRAQGIFHLSGNDRLSPYEIAIRTARHFSLDESLITPVPTSELIQTARRPLKTSLDISKARRELSYEPHSFDEGLRLMAMQLRD